MRNYPVGLSVAFPIILSLSKDRLRANGLSGMP